MLVPSEDSLASAIADIWSELLEVQDVGPETDFFELGGNSLAAVRMLAAVEERMAVQVDFVDFLDGPTVGALASAVARELANRPDAPVASAPTPSAPAHDGGTHEQGADGDARLSFAQERLWFLEQLGGIERRVQHADRRSPARDRRRGRHETGVAGCRQPSRGPADDVRHARRTRRGDAPRRTARWNWSCSTCAASRTPRARRSGSSTELASRPFDLERGPLLRAVLLRVADDEHVLELVFHHIVCDGCSQTVVMRELGTLYEAYRRGEQIAAGRAEDTVRGVRALPARARSKRRGSTRSTAPWLERLAGAPEALELPSDRPRPATPSYGARRTACRSRRTRPLRSVASHASARATPFATLLAAYYALLYRHGGQEDIVIGATTAGRDRPELEDGVGLFANTVALRGDLSGEPSFGELVARVRETVLWAMAHEQAPLQEIVARLAIGARPQPPPAVPGVLRARAARGAARSRARSLTTRAPRRRASI